MRKMIALPILLGMAVLTSGCLSSASSFVASSAPVEQGRYTELAADSCAGIREILNRSLKNYRLSYSERDCYFVIQDAEYR